MTKPSRERDVSQRLRGLREQVFGPRGRAAFARALGVSPSTYHYYEKGRQPPADLLARAAEVTGANLTWLLTGRGEPFPAEAGKGGDIRLSHPARNALQRFAEDVGDSVRAPAAQAALRKLLGEIEGRAPLPESLWQTQTFTPGPTSIPILGRTAAGVPAPWQAYFAGESEPDMLGTLLARVETRPSKRRRAEVAAADPQVESAAPAGASAMLIQLSEPTPGGVAEFLDVPGLRPVEPGTFALRVDGNSMAPRIRDGDVVISRRDAEPLPGQTAIVKIRDRIGVTVKLWRPEGDRVHLIPINETYDQRAPRRSAILWACRVLWVVRL